MRRESALAYLSLAVFTLIVLYPLVGLVLVALQPPGLGTSIGISNLTFENFRRSWSEADLSHALVASTIIAATVTLLSTFLSILAGYAFAQLRFRGSSVLFYAVLLGIIFPVEGLIVPLYYELQAFDLLDRYAGIILPQTAFSIAFGTFWMRAVFRSIPRSIMEAAVVDGAKHSTALRRICVPAVRPAILTLMVLFFMWSWNDFLLPLVIVSGERFRTAPLTLAFFVGQRTTDVPALAAAAITIAVPVLVVYVVLQRHFVRGMLGGAAKT